MTKRISGYALMAALTIMLVGIVSVPAAADQTRSFYFTTVDGDIATATLTLADGSGWVDIKSISGSYVDAGASMTSTSLTLSLTGVPTSIDPNITDNLYNTNGVTPPPPYFLSTGGFAFTATFPNSTTESYAVFQDSADPTGYAGCWAEGNPPSCKGRPTITFVSANFNTPEPSSMLLLGTGLIGALAAVRRKLT